LVLSATLTVLLSSVVKAAEERAGTVLAVDQAAGRLVLLVGPWRMKEEDIVAGNLPLTMTLTPSTRIRVIPRAATAPKPTHEFVLAQASSEVGALKPGVFAIITFTPNGRELMAKDDVEVVADPMSLYPTPPAAPAAMAVRPQ
jgi:hypothetical protein